MADIKVGVKRTQELAAILAASEEEDEIFKPTRTMSDEELRASAEEYDIGQSDNKKRQLRTVILRTRYLR